VEGKILLEIVTPEKAILSEETGQVTAPGEEGEFGVLPGHTPFMTTLKSGEVKYEKEGYFKYLSINWGFAEVTEERVNILVETAELAGEIDIQRAQSAKSRAEERLKTTNREDVDYARARAALNRALTRIQVAGRI